jgi:RNA recognition motif-containing protein
LQLTGRRRSFGHWKDRYRNLPVLYFGNLEFCFFSGKLIVRNIPFKTKINNLKKIFSIFGKILSIRLPKRGNGENRGFAFIKYNHLNDAKKALFFVQNTKIDSRSLRINLVIRISNIDLFNVINFILLFWFFL